SLLAISAMGAFFHNSMQLIVVYFLLFRNISINSKSILMFVWGFLLMGCISGIVTGFIAERLNLRRGCLE
ncbi:MAG: Gx transporter family protein, partial [Cetobacterium sp.]